MKKNLLLIFLFVLALFTLTSCDKKDEKKGFYHFVIYEPDKDNTDLSDNKVVADYKITYGDETLLVETLIKKGDNYYFTEDGTDYLELKNGEFGLSYTKGYFKDYSKCADNTVIDLSWSLTMVNGKTASVGIGDIKLAGLEEYSFVIDGWK